MLTLPPCPALSGPCGRSLVEALWKHAVRPSTMQFAHVSLHGIFYKHARLNFYVYFYFYSFFFFLPPVLVRLFFSAVCLVAW